MTMHVVNKIIQRLIKICFVPKHKNNGQVRIQDIIVTDKFLNI